MLVDERPLVGVGVGLFGAEGADAAGDGVELVVEGGDVMVWICGGDFGVEPVEGAGFGGVAAVGLELLEELLHPGCGWGRPVGEGVVSVVDAGEFGVFDDVWPVFEDPVAPGGLGGGGVEEGLVDVGG